MTSPELPIPLAGMIWDGVTEYQNEAPSGTTFTWLCRMYADGTRRFSDAQAADREVMYHLRLFTDRDGWESVGVAIETPIQDPRIDRPDYRNGAGFLHYDGRVNANHANQFLDIQNYRAHAARFAHQLDSAWGNHSILSAEEADRLTTFNALADMIGSAWRRYKTWDATDPEELVIGGNNDGRLLWQVQKPEYDLIDAGLCGQCGQVEFMLEFLLSADLTAFRLAHRQGIVYTADRAATPWGLTPYDIATGPLGEFHVELRANFNEALAHYRHVVGVQDHA